MKFVLDSLTGSLLINSMKTNNRRKREHAKEQLIALKYSGVDFQEMASRAGVWRASISRLVHDGKASDAVLAKLAAAGLVK